MSLPARHTRHGRSFLTFTQDSLVDLHEELEARYPQKLLVGWYHTHPGMDIFLSGFDLWLHEHFFPYAWQVALVIEPQARHGGFFVRRPDGQPDPRRYTGFSELLRRQGASEPTFPETSPGGLPESPGTASEPSFREGARPGESHGSVVGWANLRLDGASGDAYGGTTS